MLLWLSDANQQTAGSEINNYRKSDIQIANGDEELDTMMSQFIASQSSWQMIDNIYNDFQPLASIISERLDNILKY